jgi:hypothetical protein
VLSAKPDLAQQAAGQLDRVWERFYDSLTRPVVLTIWHEPDSKVRAKQLTLPAWSAAFQHWVSHAHAYREAHGTPLTTMLNLTNGPWRWAPEDPSRYLVGARPDLFGLDCYQDVPSDWLVPEEMVDAPFEWALTHGFRQLGVPEFGAISDPRRSQWVADMVEWLDHWDSVRFASYWTDRGSKFDARTDPATIRVLKSAILRRQGSF